MKKRIWIGFCVLTAAMSLYANHGAEIKMKGLKPVIKMDDEINIRKVGQSIVIELDEYEADEVVITRRHELIVNNKKVETDESQDVLLKEYYDVSMDVFEQVKRIGWEGAKVGLGGAAIGVKAVVGVARMLLPSYSSDDFERDMEHASNRLEMKAEKLDAMGEWIDEQVDRLESIHNQLQAITPELQELDWF